MDQLTYIIDIITAMSKYGIAGLFIFGLVLLSILYLVWTLHSRLGTMADNQQVLQDEIRDLKGLIKGGTGNGINDERGHESDHSGS